MGSINALHNYTTYYNLPPKGNSGTSIVFAIFNVGQMVSELFKWIASLQGRRLPIFVGCLGVSVSTIVTSTACTLSAFIGRRFLLSFFAPFATTAGLLYLIELAPPQYRGTVAGMYNTLYYLIRTFSARLSLREAAENASLSQREFATMAIRTLTCAGLHHCDLRRVWCQPSSIKPW